MTQTMRAVVIDEPGPVTHLHLREIPLPEPGPGEVRIKIMAFGLNRSELHTRLGFAGGAVTYPRVLGIEATGLVDADHSGTFSVGQQVMTMMGGMGRSFDGGYAQYTCVPAVQVIPFSSDLPWDALGAIPEMLQTAYGSLTIGLNLKQGQSLLVRGGTSSVGMAAAVLAKRVGATVLSTTRSPGKAEVLTGLGVDHVLIDDGNIAAQVRTIMPAGVDGAIELVGAPTLPDTLAAVRVHGTVCFTGMLSNKWTVENFYPIDYLPQGVRLTAYSGSSENLPTDILEAFLDDVATGRATVPIDRVFDLENIREAHTLMESDGNRGKIVVLPWPVS